MRVGNAGRGVRADGREDRQKLLRGAEAAPREGTRTRSPGTHPHPHSDSRAGSASEDKASPPRAAHAGHGLPRRPRAGPGPCGERGRGRGRAVGSTRWRGRGGRPRGSGGRTSLLGRRSRSGAGTCPFGADGTRSAGSLSSRALGTPRGGGPPACRAPLCTRWPDLHPEWGTPWPTPGSKVPRGLVSRGSGPGTPEGPVRGWPWADEGRLSGWRCGPPARQPHLGGPAHSCAHLREEDAREASGKRGAGVCSEALCSPQ